jgi:hypothetical protein
VPHHARLAFVVLCVAAYMCVSPGRIAFPDDEIVYQTTRSLWERGDLAVEGIAKRTGELTGRPTGTFGWAAGRDGRRYGFFGHALSVAALPNYGLGKVLAAHAPDTWRHAVRSDHFWFHSRDRSGDFTRMAVTWTNAWIGAIAAWLFAEWILALGYSLRTAIVCGLALAFGTAAFPYARTFLSEPLSMVWLLLAALALTRWHAARAPDRPSRPAWAWLAAGAAALSLHTHLLNVLALPVLCAWLWWPLRREGRVAAERRAWLGAVVIVGLGGATLALSHALRFGSPLETGRYDHYSWFVVPFEGLAAILVAPGRSLWLYSPALLVALPGVRRFFSRHRDIACVALALVIVRWVFVACRSDWWGGWSVGSRYLVPVLPFLLLPLAEVVERARGARRVAVHLALATAAVAELWLSLHNIAEWMMKLRLRDGEAYLQRSHWWPSRSPYVGFSELAPDTLVHGALRLRAHGHPGFSWVMLSVLAVGAVALAVLLRALVRSRNRP